MDLNMTFSTASGGNREHSRIHERFQELTECVEQQYIPNTLAMTMMCKGFEAQNVE
jgi:hypothetical protein